MADDAPSSTNLDRYRVREWFIAFKHDTPIRLARILTAGQRFRHVACFGFIPAIGCWLFHDWCLAGTVISVVPDEDADPVIAQMQAGAVVVRFVPPWWRVETRLKAGLWCVTATSHLTGVRSSALRPDALFRDCLADGGTIVVGEAADGRAVSKASNARQHPAPAGAGGGAD